MIYLFIQTKIHIGINFCLPLPISLKALNHCMFYWQISWCFGSCLFQTNNNKCSFIANLEIVLYSTVSQTVSQTANPMVQDQSQTFPVKGRGTNRYRMQKIPPGKQKYRNLLTDLLILASPPLLLSHFCIIPSKKKT